MAAAGVDRPTPWDLLLAPVAARYPELGAVPPDLAAFGRHPEAQRLIAVLESPELVGRAPVAAAEYQYLLLADHQHWIHGRPVLPVDGAALDAELASPGDAPVPMPAYLQLPARRWWAQPDPAGPHEPLDGCYVIPLVRNELLIVAILGLHAGRAGASQVTLAVPAAALAHARDALPDPPFAPAMPGGREAGFRSVRTAAELVHLVRVALGTARA